MKIQIQVQPRTREDPWKHIQEYANHERRKIRERGLGEMEALVTAFAAKFIVTGLRYNVTITINNCKNNAKDEPN